MLEGFNSNSGQSYFDSLNTLKAEALTLSNEEKLLVGIPVTIALNSSKYWKLNAATWRDKFWQQQINDNGVYLKKPTINLTEVGVSDVSGAVTGAYGGAVLGVGGALAGGVLGSSTGSLFNIGHQLIGQFTGWW